MSTTSKSPRRVLRVAYVTAQQALPAYSHPCSPKKFTQHQLFACLVLMRFFKTDYRGIVAILEDWPELRADIGLEKTPHFTTLQKALHRLIRARHAHRLLKQTIDIAIDAGVMKRRVDPAAADSTGFEAQPTSHHFAKRREPSRKSGGKPRKRPFPKAATLADCQSHLILSLHTGRGPKPDHPHLERLLTDARRHVGLTTLLADAGYDAEHLHRLCRADMGIRSLIPAKIGRPTDKRPTGYWRRVMTDRLHLTRYGQRWQVETVFWMIKRRLGSALRARGYWSQRRAMTLHALTHNILILRRRRGFLKGRFNAIIDEDPVSLAITTNNRCEYTMERSDTPSPLSIIS